MDLRGHFRGRSWVEVKGHLSPSIMLSCRHWVQASWNHCWQRKHCSIFRHHLHTQSHMTTVVMSPTPPRPLVYLLSRATAVAIRLLLIGPVLGVPVQARQVVGQHLLHGRQGFSNGAFLQSATFLWGGQPAAGSLKKHL